MFPVPVQRADHGQSALSLWLWEECGRLGLHVLLCRKRLPASSSISRDQVSCILITWPGELLHTLQLDHRRKGGGVIGTSSVFKLSLDRARLLWNFRSYCKFFLFAVDPLTESKVGDMKDLWVRLKQFVEIRTVFSTSWFLIRCRFKDLF